jgi:hypothetical protein
MQISFPSTGEFMAASKSLKKQNPNKLPGRLWFSLISLGFVGSLAWAVENQFFNTFLYNKITPDPRPISWMVAASAITATVASILIGTLGDRLRYKYGRKPILLIGYIMWGITTAAFPLAAFLKPIALAIAIAILFDCLMTFFGSGANDANFNAFATDVTNVNNRGKVLGVLQILTWVSMLFVYGASGLIIEALDYEAYFFIVGGMVLVLGIAGAVLIQEEKPAGPPTGTFWGQIADTFQWKKLSEQRDLLLVLLGITLWGIAQQIWFPYLMIYLTYYLKLSTGEAPSWCSLPSWWAASCWPTRSDCWLINGAASRWPSWLFLLKWSACWHFPSPMILHTWSSAESCS